METALTITGMAAAALMLYLDVAAIIALEVDRSLTPSQRIMQILLVVLVPLIGALIVLRLSHLATGGKSMILYLPWPFRSIVKGTPTRTNPDAESFEERRSRLHNI